MRSFENFFSISCWIFHSGTWKVFLPSNLSLQSHVLIGREVGVLDSVHPVVSDSVQTGWQSTVSLSLQVGRPEPCIRATGARATGASFALMVQSVPAAPPVISLHVGRGPGTQSTPGVPLVPGWPLQIGIGDLHPTPGWPFLPLQTGLDLLVQLVSGMSESAPVQVGRVPLVVVIWAALGCGSCLWAKWSGVEVTKILQVYPGISPDFLPLQSGSSFSGFGSSGAGSTQSS